jgi:phospholipid transport system substrate-binding protein
MLDIRNLCTIVAACLLWTSNVAAAEQAPDVLVRETTGLLLKTIRADPQIAAGDRKRITEVVEANLVEHFDFARMTRLAVGKNWRNIEPARQPELISEFKTLLVRTYSVSLAEYRDQVITYKPVNVEPGARGVVVQTTITQSGTSPISMNYRMAATAQGWKVYDVIVEGVSLVITYRSLFNSTVDSSGVEGLIKLLRDKNEEAQ